VVWGSIWAVFFFSLALAGYLHYMVAVYESQVPVLQSPNMIKAYGAFSTGLFVASMLWLCIILYLRDRLALAIGLVIQTAKALSSMPIIVVLVPVLQVLAYASFMLPWVYYCIMLAASGDITVVQTSITSGEYSAKINIKTFK
jgi:hypothetical protein